MTKLIIGTILKTQGLKGCVKVFSQTDFAPTRYKKGNNVYIETKQGEEIKVTVSDYYFYQGFDYVTFEEDPTIESITPLLGSKIFANKEELPPLEEGSYYFCDLVNLDVIDEKRGNVGKVIEINDYVGRRSLRVQLKNKKEILIPYIGAFIKKVDLANKRIEVTLIDGMVD